MIVVDCNIILYFLIQGDYTSRVEALQKSQPHWIAPQLWVDEFCNVLCTMQRAKQLTQIQALELTGDALLLISESHEISPERIFTISQQTGCSGYDSQYIALAEDLGVPLYTFDQKILKAAPKTAIAPK